MQKTKFLWYRKKMRHIAGVILAVSVALGAPVTVNADTYEQQLEAQRAMAIESNQVEGWPQGPVVTAESAILIEAETGTVLYGKNIHKQEYPASTTKILTCLIAYEECELDEMVTMSKRAVYDTPRGSNHIALDVGEAITMEEALHAILIRSANEVAFAVGEHISGTTWEDFGPIMNERAKELGCLNSHFINPNGLPDENHYTTAYDLSMIARAFFDNELLSKISRTTKLELFPTDTQPDHIIEHTKNQLLRGQKKAYEYLVGSKTGYTDAARNCLVSCAEKDGMKLICVVLRDSSNAHYDDTIALFDYGFQNFTKVNVSQNETKFNIDNTGLFYSDHDVFGSSKSLLSLNKEDFLVLPVSASFADTVSTISYDTEKEGQAAVISYTWNGVPVGTASIDFTENIESSFTFDEVISSKEEGAEDEISKEETAKGEVSEEPENSSRALVFLKKAAIITACLLVLALLFLGILFITRNPGIFQRGGRRSRRRRRRSSFPSYSSVNESRRQERKMQAREARNRRRRRRHRKPFSG